MRKPGVVIIGGGAAGLTAAIVAARDDADVTILEGGARVGRKVLASGNGRCNLSNSAVSPRGYNHPEFVEPMLAAYSCQDIRDFFEGMGLLTYADSEGRVYPTTNAAASVLEVLRLECAHLGVTERCDSPVASITESSTGLEVTLRDGEQLSADAVIVATGGGESLLAGLGHGHIECTPVLGPLKTELDPIRGLSGIRVKCAARILDASGEPLAAERGELLFRDYGVSGIMIFDLSRFAEEGRTLSIDFFPDADASEFRTLISERCSALSWRTAETFFDGMLQSRVATAILRAAHIDPKTPVASLPCDELATLLKDFRLTITGRGDAKQSQVTRGGAAVAQFDPATMASRLAQGLFAAGEVLDIDGRCGGYNLHWAWASGIVAGQSAARAAAHHASAQSHPGDSA